jgi:hypothetical protein
MKYKPLFFLLMVAAGASALPPARAIAQVTFVQTPPRNPDQPASQQNLPPEKKKSLSGLGPDELFSDEQESRRPTPTPQRASRRARRTSSASPTPSPTPTSTPKPAPASAAIAPDAGSGPAPSESVPAPERAAPRPAPTTAPISVSMPEFSTSNRMAGVRTTLIHLALWIMMFTTLGLLVFVLSRLRVLLSEG